MIVSTVDALLEYQVAAPTHFCFNIEAAHCASQNIVSEKLTLSPDVAVRHFRDEGNGNRFLRFDAPAGPLTLRYQTEVQLFTQAPDPDLPEVPVSQIPDDILHYTLPTRYCESDVMAGSALQMFGEVPPGLRRVQTIVDWIRDAITYLPGSTDSTSTAQDVFVRRAGVCRDFAHLGITMCRALNIPARLVVGYVWFDEPPQDFHAVFEAWLGGQWVLFDPTGMAPVERLVRSGTGRDAKDVAFSTIFGAVTMTRKDLRIVERDAQGELRELVKAQAVAEEA